MMRFGPLLTAPLLATLLATPGLGAEEDVVRTRPPALEGSSLTWCGDVQPIPIDPNLLADSPVYVANEQPTGEVKQWAKQQPGYQDIWIDRDHFGWLVVAFTQDVAARQADLQERFPDDGVVAVQVEHPTKELRALQDRLVDELRGSFGSFSVGVDVTSNITDLWVPYVTEEIVADLEARFAGEPFCIDGQDPAERPVAGPQPTGGDGWTMVGHEHMDAGGQNYRTGVSSSEAQFERLWKRSGIDGEAPAVDLVEDVVLWFAVGHGSSCPNLRLDDVVVDLESATIYPDIVDLDGNVGCTDDLVGTYQYVVALDRARLPAGPFVVQLDAPHGNDVSRDQTVVDLDLTAPGTIATKGQIHAAAAPRGQPPGRSGTTVETMGTTPYLMDVSCGIGYLGEVNDMDWMTDGSAVPEAWRSLVDARDEVLVDIALRAKPEPYIDATANDLTIRYLPTTEAPPACEG